VAPRPPRVDREVARALHVHALVPTEVLDREERGDGEARKPHAAPAIGHQAQAAAALAGRRGPPAVRRAQGLVRRGDPREQAPLDPPRGAQGPRGRGVGAQAQRRDREVGPDGAVAAREEQRLGQPRGEPRAEPVVAADGPARVTRHRGHLPAGDPEEGRKRPAELRAQGRGAREAEQVADGREALEVGREQLGEGVGLGRRDELFLLLLLLLQLLVACLLLLLVPGARRHGQLREPTESLAADVLDRRRAVIGRREVALLQALGPPRDDEEGLRDCGAGPREVRTVCTDEPRDETHRRRGLVLVFVGGGGGRRQT